MKTLKKILSTLEEINKKLDKINLSNSNISIDEFERQLNTNHDYLTSCDKILINRQKLK